MFTVNEKLEKEVRNCTPLTTKLGLAWPGFIILPSGDWRARMGGHVSFALNRGT